MATLIQFLRSATPRLRPNPADLAGGMPMINMAPEEPGLYFKLTDDSLTKIGPTYIGVVPPNSGPSGHVGNTIGEQWLDVTDPDDPILKIWDGQAWKHVSGGGTGAQVQSNWNEVDSVNPAFIKNKPTIVSEFSNDAGYITAATQVKSNWLEAVNTSAAFIENKPTALSDFNNNLNFLTESTQVKSNWNEVDSTSAAFIQNKPTDLGDFTNTPGFIVNAVTSVNGDTGPAVSLAPDNISDVSTTGANNNNVLVYNGSSWEPGPGVSTPPSVTLKGTFDVSDINTLPSSSVVGDTYIQKSPTPGLTVTADANWPNIGGDSADDGAFVYYVDVAGTETWVIGNNNISSFQSDWTETDTAANTFIQNKPTALSDFTNDVVNDAVLTIKDVDGNSLGTFSANQSDDEEISIPGPLIPVKWTPTTFSSTNVEQAFPGESACRPGYPEGHKILSEPRHVQLPDQSHNYIVPAVCGGGNEFGEPVYFLMLDNELNITKTIQPPVVGQTVQSGQLQSYPNATPYPGVDLNTILVWSHPDGIWCSVDYGDTWIKYENAYGGTPANLTSDNCRLYFELAGPQCWRVSAVFNTIPDPTNEGRFCYDNIKITEFERSTPDPNWQEEYFYQNDINLNPNYNSTYNYKVRADLPFPDGKQLLSTHLALSSKNFVKFANNPQWGSFGEDQTMPNYLISCDPNAYWELGGDVPSMTIVETRGHGSVVNIFEENIFKDWINTFPLNWFRSDAKVFLEDWAIAWDPGTEAFFCFYCSGRHLFSGAVRHPWTTAQIIATRNFQTGWIPYKGGTTHTGGEIDATGASASTDPVPVGNSTEKVARAWITRLPGSTTGFFSYSSFIGARDTQVYTLDSPVSGQMGSWGLNGLEDSGTDVVWSAPLADGRLWSGQSVTVDPFYSLKNGLVLDGNFIETPSVEVGTPLTQPLAEEPGPLTPVKWDSPLQKDVAYEQVPCTTGESPCRSGYPAKQTFVGQPQHCQLEDLSHCYVVAAACDVEGSPSGPWFKIVFLDHELNEIKVAESPIPGQGVEGGVLTSYPNDTPNLSNRCNNILVWSNSDGIWISDDYADTWKRYGHKFSAGLTLTRDNCRVYFALSGTRIYRWSLQFAKTSGSGSNKDSFLFDGIDYQQFQIYAPGNPTSDPTYDLMDTHDLKEDPGFDSYSYYVKFWNNTWDSARELHSEHHGTYPSDFYRLADNPWDAFKYDQEHLNYIIHTEPNAQWKIGDNWPDVKAIRYMSGFFEEYEATIFEKITKQFSDDHFEPGRALHICKIGVGYDHVLNGFFIYDPQTYHYGSLFLSRKDKDQFIFSRNLQTGWVLTNTGLDSRDRDGGWFHSNSSFEAEEERDGSYEPGVTHMHIHHLPGTTILIKADRFWYELNVPVNGHHKTYGGEFFSGTTAYQYYDSKEWLTRLPDGRVWAGIYVTKEPFYSRKNGLIFEDRFVETPTIDVGQPVMKELT